ncbi:hypothetical protein GCM10027341_12390 [Spirosoma knui]
MAAHKKQVIRIVFDVLDEAKHNLWLNGDLSVTASDPDEAIDWVFTQMQRQFNRTDIRLSRVRICA